MGKRKKRLSATVQKVIKPRVPGETEKAQIDIDKAEHLYREIRIDNELTDENGEKTRLKPGAQVEVVIEADSSATTKKTEDVT